MSLWSESDIQERRGATLDWGDPGRRHSVVKNGAQLDDNGSMVDTPHESSSEAGDAQPARRIRLRTATVIAATPVVVGLLMLSSSVLTSSGPELLDHDVPEAQEVAEAFAKATIETGWDEARAYLSSSGPMGEWVDRDHDFFVAHEFVITGRAQFDDRVGLLSGLGYKVPAQGLEGIRDLEDAVLIEWTIGVEVVEEDGSWKVIGYDYTAGPTIETD
jgi:hypothetical protein